MMPLTRQEIEILLDTPDRRDYVVSAYADMTVKDGFSNHVEIHLKNQARAAGKALTEAEARHQLDANIEAIRRAVRSQDDPRIKGLAVFSGASRGLLHSVPLHFPVENLLVIDEEPFVLPLLERWFGEPVYLVARACSDRAHLFEAYAGAVEPVRHLEREDAGDDIQRDKPRFTYKKRFAKTQHERLHGTDEDKFLQEVAERIDDQWHTGRFTGLILLGQPQITGPLARLLPKELQAAVVEHSAHVTTGTDAEVAAEVARVIEKWHVDRDRQLLGELESRWKEHYHVADGPTDVLDALQQGRATQVVIGSRRDLPGARCESCGYRFGAPSITCLYCQGPCQSINATQEILRMALRHKVPAHLLRRSDGPDPLARAGGVAALLRAEANWAPDAEVARASEGH